MRCFFDGQFKHIYNGKVISETPHCLILFAKSFHFRKITKNYTTPSQRIKETYRLYIEDVCERSIPCTSIEFAQIIEEPINYEGPAVWAECGKIVFDYKQKKFIKATHDHEEKKQKNPI